jgi:hypothetical protein
MVKGAKNLQASVDKGVGVVVIEERIQPFAVEERQFFHVKGGMIFVHFQEAIVVPVGKKKRWGKAA